MGLNHKLGHESFAVDLQGFGGSFPVEKYFTFRRLSRRFHPGKNPIRHPERRRGWGIGHAGKGIFCGRWRILNVRRPVLHAGTPIFDAGKRIFDVGK